MTQQREAIEVEQGQLQPVQPRQRIRELDVLRGFAIFGIFMVNIGLFAGPMGYIFMPGDMPEPMTTGEVFSYCIVRGLFEMKFVSLFSMMFGMGMAVQLMRAERSGKPFVPMYIRRIAVLGVFGFVHAFFLWYGDILFIYTWTALIALLFVRMQARSLFKLAIGGVILAAVVSTLLQAIMLPGAPAGPPSPEVVAAEVQQDPAVATDAIPDDGGAQPAEPTPLEELFALFEQMGTDPKGGGPNSEPWIEAERMAYSRGPMSVTLIMRATAVVSMLIFVVIGGFGFRVLGMFLLGMALIKMGFFDRERHELVRRVFRICLPVGLAGEALAVGVGYANGFEPGSWMLATEPLHWIASFLLALGYAAGMVLLYRSGALRLLVLGLEGIGRTALSNYLAQTIIATTIFYWWGFGLFETVSRPYQLLMVVGIFTSQMIVTFIWLRFFRFGPFEWLWRSLTYWKPQAMRR